MITTLRLRCPACQRALLQVDVADSETAVYRRRCRKCRRRWQAKIRLAQRKKDSLVMHYVEWATLTEDGAPDSDGSFTNLRVEPE